MTQPPKGPGALSLLLRLSMLRSRQRGVGSLAERGYSLAVALIAAFVLLLGVAALASRSQLGFVGQVFQVQNRQARDVAESAIAEFANVLNREENRLLLVANGTNWGALDNRNVCTIVDAGDNLAISAGDPDDPATFDPVSGAPDPDVIARFSPVTFAADPDIFVALPGSAVGQYRVEEIRWLQGNRDDFEDPADDPNGLGTRGRMIAGLEAPTLLRVTMIGRVNQNGRISTARVAREFEVVPKCCKRSFDPNQFGATNYGRDERGCDIGVAVAGPGGIIVGLGGGTVSGSSNQKQIYDENGNILADANCWAGNIDDDNSDLDGSANPTCVSGDLALGDPDTTGISFTPTEFDFQFPSFGGAAPTPLYPTITVANNATRYITYYKDPAIAADPGGIRLCEISGASYINCSRLDGQLPTYTATPDPCHQVANLDLAANPPRPYYRYNCQLQNIVLSNPGSTLRFDTTNTQVNLLFYNSTYSGLYLGGNGAREISRVHCRSNLSATPSTTASCGQPVVWDKAVTDPASYAYYDFRSQCTLADCDRDQYNVGELLNVYANGSGTFDLRGTAQAFGFNIYAPFATVDLRGGGGADPNFMGRIWVNNFNITGNVKIATFSAGGPGGRQGDQIIQRFDFIARSFTQASGF